MPTVAAVVPENTGLPAMVTAMLSVAVLPKLSVTLSVMVSVEAVVTPTLPS